MAVFIQDTFTDTNNTALTSHTGEVGASWTKHGDVALDGVMVITDNRIRNSSSPSVYIASGTTTETEYDVTAVLHWKTVTQNGGIIASASSSTQTWYEIRAQSGAIRLIKAVAGSVTVLGQHNITTSAGQTITVKLKIRDDGVAMDVNATVDAVTSNDTVVPRTSVVGVRIVAGSATQGLHIDSIEAADFTTAGPEEKDSADSGVGTESATVVVTLVDSDTGTGTDDQSIVEDDVILSESYMLIDANRLATLPTTGAAWDYLVARANDALAITLDEDSADSPWLSNYNTGGSSVGFRRLSTMCLAMALVYARTGTTTYRDAVEDWLRHIMGSEEGPATDGTGDNDRALATMRQLAAFIMAADLIDFDGSLTGSRTGWTTTTWDDWLATLLTKQLDTAGMSQIIKTTHETFATNQSLWAGAARVALAIYQGDEEDLADAVEIFQRFLGDTTKYQQFSRSDDFDSSYVCLPPGGTDPLTDWVALNGSECGDGKDGLIVEDISRSAVSYPDYDNVGRTYLLDAYQAALVIALLLNRHPLYNNVWNWSNQALKRTGDWIDREGIWPGVDSANNNQVEQNVPWIPNYFYGTEYATTSAQMGRSVGFTDWLFAPESEEEGDLEEVVFVQDTFTDTDGTPLTSHTGEIGANWTAHPVFSSSEGAITSNRARMQSSPGILFTSGTPPIFKHEVNAEVYVSSVTGQGGFMACVDPVNATWYEIRVQSGQVRLIKSVNNTVSLIGIYGVTTGVGDTITIKLKITSTSKNVDVNGVIDAITSSDTDITDPGRIGVRLFGSGASTGFHLNQISASSLVTITPDVVADSDTGSSSEGQTIEATLGSSDEGEGTDDEAIAITSSVSDSGTSTDGATIATTLTASDEGAGTEEEAVVVVSSDSDEGSGAESSTIASSLETSDDGEATEGNAITALTSSTDSGTSSDEAAVLSTIVETDSGIGTETTSTVAAVTSTDSGTATESAMIVVTLVDSDAGVGIDLANVNSGDDKSDSDFGTGTESQSVVVTDLAQFSPSIPALLGGMVQTTVSLPGAMHLGFNTSITVEVGDADVINQSNADSGVGTESASIVVTLIESDEGIGVDNVSIASELGDSDSGSFIENISLFGEVLGTEVGSSIEVEFLDITPIDGEELILVYAKIDGDFRLVARRRMVDGIFT